MYISRVRAMPSVSQTHPSQQENKFVRVFIWLYHIPFLPASIITTFPKTRSENGLCDALCCDKL